MKRLKIAGAVMALALVGQGTAVAAPCSELPGPIYGIGGSASKPFLGKISKALAALPDPDTQTIVFQAPGACVGIYALLNNTKLTGTASYWDASGVEKTCDLPANGQDADFANMANSAALCPLAPATLPADIGDYEGSVNTVNLIVPVASSQRSISAAAAYFVFGFGNGGQAAPWTIDNEITIRDQNSAVQQLLGLAINVPASKFAFGVNGASQNGVITRVSQSQTPESAIGFVSGEAADLARATVRTLAYQHYGQSCGYLPDSTATALDKVNVREGRYFLWTPQHFFAKKDAATNVVTSPAARKLIGYITGELAQPAGFDLLRIEIEGGTVPKCAMRVWREGDLGAVHRYTPAKACHGFFESLTGGTTATACPNGPSDCSAPAPACNHGYCEVQ
ncbi:MAG: hypothetical protein SFX73_23475 [Kofleriaceae bacterium]|nr:hypothetical protein [Kofleriaceae bacterium]